MAMHDVYSQNVQFKYKSTVCSKSTIFSVCTTFLSFLLPLLVAYRTHGFWLKISEYVEQPTVRFKYDYLLFIETDKPNQPILCSNLPITTEFDRCSVIRSREEDNNRDGKYDELILKIEIDIPPDVGIYTIQLILLFDYILQKQCLLQMETLAIIHYNSGIPGCSLDVVGDLKLIQKQLLTTKEKHLLYNKSIFNTDDEESGFDLNINNIIKNYAKRNVSTKLQNLYRTWASGVLLDETFKLNVNINYPEERILYKPSFWQIMKWAWIQYFSLLFIFLNIFQRIKGYIFMNHLIPTVKEIPWKKTM